MEYLTQIFISQVGDRETAGQLSIFFISAAAFCVIFGLLLLANSYFDPVRSRFLGGATSKKSLTGDRSNGTNVYQKYSHILMSSDQELIGRTMQRLNYAGFHYNKNLYQYYAIRFILMITLPLLTLIIFLLVPGIKQDYLFQGAAFSFALGYIGPSFTLDRLIAKRQKIIQRAFPDALDLLVVCSEAGLSLDSAIQKVASEISFSQPVLAQELGLVIAEVRAGVDRKKAFNGLGERTGVEAIQGLMSSINQCMRFGSSISETLRIYSEDFRDKRVQAAEEKAAKISSKLIFPIALCLLPCFILIVIVPMGLSLIKLFNNL
jgi:tight adherence protein C